MQGIALAFACMFTFFTGCGGEETKNKSQRTKVELSEAQNLRDDYKSRAKLVSNSEGFIEYKKCDSLLFSGLACAAGWRVHLDAAEGEPGRWYRSVEHTCYDEGRSRSDISRDALIGMLWCSYVGKRTDLIQDLYDYGKSHDWKMGRGPVDIVYLTPNFINTIRILLGKRDDVPEVWVDPIKDHQRHIVALNIALRGEAEGNIRDDQLKLIKKFRSLNPENALYQYIYHRYTDGDHKQTVYSLLNKKLFPPGRLPNNRDDRCEEWLWGRDSGKEDWKPCPNEKFKRHSGADLGFIVALLENSL